MNIIFTEHARSRMKKRRISEEEVIETVEFPSSNQIDFNKITMQKDLGRGKIEVVLEKTEKYIRIITVYWL